MASLIVNEWAARHGVSQAALDDLKAMLTPDGAPKHSKDRSEAYVDSVMMLEAADKNILLMRNNVGAYQDATGRMVRYGFANESKEQNKRMKSSDRIGIKPVLITPSMVGSTIGQFVARETKKEAWTGKTLNAHEQAQFNFLVLALLYGADACFANSVGTL